MMVLVGKRDGALTAAQRLGVDVVLVVERAPRRAPPIVRAVIESSFATQDWAPVARRVRTLGKAEAVVALTEAAVLPAATLRMQLGLPGLQPAQALQCTDKAAMKRAVAAAAIPCAPFVHARESIAVRQIVEQLGLPLVLKPARSSGGRGMRRLDALADLPPTLPSDYLAEALVRGAEMSVESFVREGEPVFVNVTEYVEPRWANLLPARLPEGQHAALLDLNRRAIHALGVERGMTHLEAYLGADGFVFGELAARPPGGHLMELIELAYGFDPWSRCLELERGRSPQPIGPAQCFAGVRVLHPGPGTVTRVSGLDVVERLPQLARLVCRVQPGDVVEERTGAGQEVGYVVFKSSQRDEVADALEAARRSISFELS